MHAETCPVCKGRGKKPKKFYGEKGSGEVDCRSCHGRGWLEVVGTGPAPIQPIPYPIPYPQPYPVPAPYYPVPRPIHPRPWWDGPVWIGYPSVLCGGTYSISTTSNVASSDLVVTEEKDTENNVLTLSMSASALAID